MENPIRMFFSTLEDPRSGDNVLYPLEEILLVAIVCFFIGGEGYEDMEDTGEIWEDELRRYYPFKRGTPSADTFRYVLMNLDPRKFGDCFAKWMSHLHENVEGLIAVDGKSSRGSGKNKNALSPITTVSAYCHERGVTMACIDTEDKSNEITVLPKLLEMLDLRKSVVSLDAMGCQKNVAKQIIEQKGEYLISLKGNQGTLHQEVSSFFEALAHEYPDYKGVEKEFVMDVYEYEDHSKSREYRRRIVSTSDFCGGLEPFRSKWEGLKSIVMIESWCTVKGQTSFERRYAISSLDANSKDLAKLIRGHWSVENNLHWMLDLYFDDDGCTVRNRNAAKNFAILKRIALNTLQEHKKSSLKKKSIRRTKRIASMSPKHVHQMIQLTKKQLNKPDAA